MDKLSPWPRLYGPLPTAFWFCLLLTIIHLVFLPQVSMASLDSEAPLTLSLNLSRLSLAEHILKLRPALESLGRRVRYVIAHGNEQGFFRMHHLRGLSSLQLGRRRLGPGTYQLEVVSTARPWGIWPEGQPGPGVLALRLKVRLQLV